MFNPAYSQNPLPYRKVEVSNMARDIIAQLRTLGAVELTPPEFTDPSRSDLEFETTLWNVPTDNLNVISSFINNGIWLRDEYDKILVNGLEFYPAFAEPTIPNNLCQNKQQGYQLWLVQFDYLKEVALRDWLDSQKIFVVRDTGQVGLIVWVNGKQLATIEAQTNPAGPIIWTGPYHPYYRMSPQIRNLVETKDWDKDIEVSLVLYNHEEIQTSLNEIQTLTNNNISYSSLKNQPVILRMFVNLRQIEIIVKLPDTILVRHYHTFVLADEIKNQM